MRCWASASSKAEDVPLGMSSRSSCLMSLICFRYRAHHVQTSRCNLSCNHSHSPRERSIDSDINGAIFRHGWSDRRSHRLNTVLIVTNAFKFAFSLIRHLVFFALPLRSLRLCGFIGVCKFLPQRRREREGSAEKRSNKTTLFIRSPQLNLSHHNCPALSCRCSDLQANADR